MHTIVALDQLEDAGAVADRRRRVRRGNTLHTLAGNKTDRARRRATFGPRQTSPLPIAGDAWSTETAAPGVRIGGQRSAAECRETGTRRRKGVARHAVRRGRVHRRSERGQFQHR